MYQYRLSALTMQQHRLSALTMQQHRCMQEICNMLHRGGNNLDAVHIAVLPVSTVVILP